MAVWRAVPGGIVVSLRLTPRADRDAIGGASALAEGREVLRARVRALPSEGAANAALVALVAKTLSVPKSAVAIVSGDTQRIKLVRIEGDAATLVARLNQAMKARPADR